MANSGKVNKNDFLKRVAKKTCMNPAAVRDVFDAMIDEGKTVLCSGGELSLSGFGTFSLREHKGHPVQFEAKTEAVNDYIVLKFSPSDVLMAKIRSDCKKSSSE